MKKIYLLLISIIFVVEVNAQCTPPSTFAVGPYVIPCGSPTVEIAAGTNSATGTYTYNWTGPAGGGMSCPGGPFCYSSLVNTPGVYTVVITNTTTGCTATNTMSVSAATLPMSISGNTVICAGETTTLSASGATNYTWSTSSNSSSVAVSPTIGTTYTVYGISGSCPGQVTIAITVNPCVGIRELDLSKNISIYPNPSSGKFDLKINESINNGEIRLLNEIGQEVYKQTVKQGKNEINVGVLAKGVYYYSIYQNKVPIGRGKIIIE